MLKCERYKHTAFLFFSQHRVCVFRCVRTNRYERRNFYNLLRPVNTEPINKVTPAFAPAPGIMDVPETPSPDENLPCHTLAVKLH